MDNSTEKCTQLCRLCDQFSEDAYSVFDKSNDGKQIVHLIKECLPAIVYRTDPLSKFICGECRTNLENHYHFQKKVMDIYKCHILNLKKQDDDKNVQLFLHANENKDFKSSKLCVECNRELEEEKTELELINELQDAITESLRKNNESQCTGDEDAISNISTEPHHFNGDLSEIDKHYQCSSGEMNNVTEEFSKHLVSLKRPLEDVNLYTPPLKRKKMVGPKSRIKVLQRIRKKQVVTYEPHSLTRCVLNSINKANVPDFYSESCSKVVRELDEREALCFYCDKTFTDMQSLALHEGDHLKIELFDRIDAPLFWSSDRENAYVRNKWLRDDSKEEDIEDLLVPITTMTTTEVDTTEFEEEQDPVEDDEELRSETPPPISGDIVLINTKPTVNGIPLSEIPKDDRRYLFKTILIGGLRRKFCSLCRFTFKDNWAIELHYFSSACYYTCRYCGVRFNKQRNTFDEHVQRHVAAGDPTSVKIYASRKKNDPIPKILHETRVKTVASVLRKMPRVKPIKMKKLMQKRGYVNAPPRIKKEPKTDALEDELEPLHDLPHPSYPAEAKSQNQAYFCRKCYKVFFKLDEFNEHVNACKGRTLSNGVSAPIQTPIQTPMQMQTSIQTSTPISSKSNSESESYSSSGRPLRNCVKEVSYNDAENETGQNSGSNSPILAFECNYCNSTFPTFQSRNSHMRIHKNKMGGFSAFPEKINNLAVKPHSLVKQAMNIRDSYNSVLIKQEPMEEEEDEEEEEPQLPHKLPGHMGNVSITPLSSNNRIINPEIMKLVQNNPNLTIKSLHEAPAHAHQNISQESNNSSTAYDEARIYRCSSCSKPFTNKSTLYFHKKNHCGGSKYPCPFCKKRFGTEAAYSSHIFYSHPE